MKADPRGVVWHLRRAVKAGDSRWADRLTDEIVKAIEAEPTVHVIGPDDEWPGGISDGLTLPCVNCGMAPELDYRVTDEAWAAVVDEHERLAVMCLSCFGALADKAGISLSACLLDVQFIGGDVDETVVLRPTAFYQYSRPEDKE